MAKEELLFEFVVRTNSQGGEARDIFDLIGEGWVRDLAEWDGWPTYKKEDILRRILDGFVDDNIESWWSQVSG